MPERPPPAPPPPAPAPRSLAETALAAAARSRLDDPAALAALPEDLLIELLKRVLGEGRLTPRIAEAFKAVASAANHTQLAAFIDGLRLRDPPALIGSAEGRWLGDKSGLF
jgi:hypothetical protein